MNIYNKVTLSVILVITILISFIFYFFNKEDKLDKDDLYENKTGIRLKVDRLCNECRKLIGQKQ
mgnify:CR=1 FL=1